jgi:hypothetical protein
MTLPQGVRKVGEREWIFSSFGVLSASRQGGLLYVTTDSFAYVMLEASKGEAEASGVGYFVCAFIYDVIYRNSV